MIGRHGKNAGIGRIIQDDLDKIGKAFTKERNSFDLRRRLRAAVTALMGRRMEDGSIADFAFHVAHNGKNETESGCHEVWVDAAVIPPGAGEGEFVYANARLVFAEQENPQ